MSEVTPESRTPPGRAPVVAIDGPAGSGKSTVAAALAVALGLPHLDTGAFYRAATLACLRAGVDLDDGDVCAEQARAVRIERRDGRTLLDGEDVEDEIRGPAVTAAVSTVAAHPGVRDTVTPLQRQLAASNGGVVEGRDIATVVLPDADLKVFLDAGLDERARRRAAEVGSDDVAAMRAEIERRDELDGTRAVAPTLRAADAWQLDTTGLDVADIVAAIADRLAQPAPGQGPPADPVDARRALPRVAVVGRPNVGKSTLVNRILGRRIAIVEEKPGVTRDRTEHIASWTGHAFVVVDTGGWEHSATGMAARVVEQAENAVDSAEVALLVVDVTVGVLEADARYAQVLRRSGRPVLLVANKVDSASQEPAVHELYGLGLGEAHAVSARHGRGIGDLLDAVVAELPSAPPTTPDETAVPRVAIVGKPNVGKSSLFNRVLGQPRSIVDEAAHTTRDSVDTLVAIDGRPWVFVDTAGMRRRYRHGEQTELYSVDRTRLAVAEADIAVFIVDASEPLGEQDQRLAAMLRDAGCGVVLACNKWDQVDEQRRVDFEKELDRLLGFARFAPRVNLSALTGRGVRRMLAHLAQVWDAYRIRIPTAELNRLVEELRDRAPVPTVRGRRLRIKYVTQAEAAPPRFVVFANGAVPAPYRRFLEGELRERYGFVGVPLRIDDRASSGRG